MITIATYPTNFGEKNPSPAGKPGLKTKKLVKVLHQNGCDVVTITNHNNARSCWELIDDGADVLVAGEFTCHFPGMNCSSTF